MSALTTSWVNLFLNCTWLGELNFKQRLAVFWLYSKGYRVMPKPNALNEEAFNTLLDYSEHKNARELKRSLSCIFKLDEEAQNVSQN